MSSRSLQLQMLAELRRIRLALERQAAPEPKLFTARVAAKRLGIGLTKFMLMVQAGEIRRVKVGAALMVPAAELDRLAALPPGKTPEPPMVRAKRGRRGAGPEASAREMFDRFMNRRRR